MPLHFAGNNSEILASSGACGDLSGGGAFAFLARRDNTTSYHGVFALGVSGSDTACSPEFGSDEITLVCTTNGDDTFATFSAGTFPANTWILVVGTITSGGNTFRYNTLNLSSGEWRSATSDTTSSTTGAPTGVIFGQWTDPAGGNKVDDFYGNIAWIAYWSGGRPDAFDSDAKIQSFFDGATYAQILSTNPKALWVFDQDVTTNPVSDWTGGGANESGSRTGTIAAATSNPPLNGYGASPIYAHAADAPAAPAVSNSPRLDGTFAHFWGA